MKLILFILTVILFASCRQATPHLQIHQTTNTITNQYWSKQNYVFEDKIKLFQHELDVIKFEPIAKDFADGKIKDSADLATKASTIYKKKSNMTHYL